MSLPFLACEDGPNQTFNPAPGSLFNNGDTPGAVDDAGASFGNSSGGTSKTEICSGAELQAQWAKMVAQPIYPPYKMAGIDISGLNYAVLTVEQAENGINGSLMPAPGATNPPTRLCQGQNLGPGSNGGDVGGSLVTGWGNNNEFQMEWAINTHKDYFNQINPGYVGSMDWTYTTDPNAPGGDGKQHSYTWQIGKPITKDGQVFTLDWNGYNTPGQKFLEEADELYRGLTKFFTPELYDNLPPGTLCSQTGRCPNFPTGNDFVHPILGFRTLSMYWDMGPPSQPQPSGSTPHDAYFFNIKYAPYSGAISNLKIDAVGPTGSQNPIGDLGTDCELSLGGTFGSLATNCISVFKDPDTNKTAMAKVLGNLTHDDQNFTFSIVGINQNYRPLGYDIGGPHQFDVIHDSDVDPATFQANQQGSVAVDFTYDVRANGPILNDRYLAGACTGSASCSANPDPTTCAAATGCSWGPSPGVYGRDNHGAGAVWREFGRLVQQDLTQKSNLQFGTPIRTLHDPACLLPDAQRLPATGCSATTPCASPGSVCSSATTPPSCTFAPGINVTNWHAAPGCTGFEGFITEAYPNTDAQTGLPVNPADATVVDPNNNFDVQLNAGNISDNGLRPGTPYGLWCLDGGNLSFCGAFGGTLLGYQGPLLDGSYAMVLQVLGNGDPTKLPAGTGDYRYFFQKWTEAFAKYLASGASTHTGQLAAQPNQPTPACAPNCKPDPVPYFGNFALNTDDFFFDSYGGSANRGEFVFFDNADATHDPMGIDLQSLLIGSNLQIVHFYRRLDREERAVFMAMENADAKTAGQAAWGLAHDSANNIVKDEWGVSKKNADVFIANLAGSPAVANAANNQIAQPAWQGVPCNPKTGFVVAGGNDTTSTCPTSGPGSGACNTTGWCIVDNTKQDACNPTQPLEYTIEYCATHLDPNCLPNYAFNKAPLNAWAPQNDDGTLLTRASGDALLAGYCGIWNTTPFSLNTSGVPSQIAIVNDDVTPQTQQFNEAAEVQIPNFANPYDSTSTPGAPIKVLVPWLPFQNGVGFSVAINGQQDVFVQTAQLDFSGQVIVPVMDYLPNCCDSSGNCTATTGAFCPAGQTQRAQIVAYESQDFLGDVFLCFDTYTEADRAGQGTGRPGDLLPARMYTSTDDIFTWLAAHPGAQDSCSIIVRWSPFNNFPDYITSVTNGVRLGIDQGAGKGRVTDLTVFTPGIGAPAAP